MTTATETIEKEAKNPSSSPIRINAGGVYYRELNRQIRELVAAGHKAFELVNVNGQRYIGDGLNEKVDIKIYGVPGNDLAAFMNGPTITIFNNAQDGVGNTMNAGKVIVHGDVGDVAGYSMRGGKIFVKGNAGYRVGIHMKAYKNQVPVIIVGRRAGAFFGEYMAGGTLILLGLDESGDQQPNLTGDYLGTGMHGGTIFLRGEPDPHHLGKEVVVEKTDEDDKGVLDKILQEYCADLELDFQNVRHGAPFCKLRPYSHRPYGNLYVY